MITLLELNNTLLLMRVLVKLSSLKTKWLFLCIYIDYFNQVTVLSLGFSIQNTNKLLKCSIKDLRHNRCFGY